MATANPDTMPATAPLALPPRQNTPRNRGNRELHDALVGHLGEQLQARQVEGQVGDDAAGQHHVADHAALLRDPHQLGVGQLPPPGVDQVVGDLQATHLHAAVHVAHRGGEHDGDAEPEQPGAAVGRHDREPGGLRVRRDGRHGGGRDADQHQQRVEATGEQDRADGMPALTARTPGRGVDPLEARRPAQRADHPGEDQI